MQRQPVRSSNIAAVGYDASQRLLEIAFHNGRVYQYPGVPASVHANLLRAASVGRYFDTFIKRAFPGRRVG